MKHTFWNNSVKIEKSIVYFTFFYVTLFSLNALLRGNIEFVYYTAVMLLSIGTILFIHRRMHFYPIVLMSLSVLGLLHLLGGNVLVGETRLYEYYLVPDLFKYDNFVHMVGSGIMVMMAYTLLTPILDDRFERRQQLYFVFLLVVVGMGLGAINELIEFIAVILFDVSSQVGDYTNTLLDIVYNTLGSLVMAIFLVKSRHHLTKKLW